MRVVIILKMYLFYVTIVQMMAMKACFQIAECRLSYAKVKFFLEKKEVGGTEKVKATTSEES